MADEAQSPPTLLREFKITQDAAKCAQRKLTLRLGSIYVILMVGITAMFLWQIIRNGRNDNIPYALLFFPLAVVMTIWQLRSQRRLLADRLSSYRLTLGDNAIACRADGSPDISLPRNRITRIEVTPAGDLLVRTSQPHEFIAIPRGIENYEIIASTLHAWGEWKKGSSHSIARKLLLLAVIAGFLLIMLFLAVVGAYCDINALLKSGTAAGTLLLWVTLIVFIHGVLIFLIGGILKQDWDIISIASNANIGGATSAPVCANSIGRPDLQLPGLLAGSVGNAIGTYLGIIVAEWLK